MKRRAQSSEDSLDTWVERVLRKDERALAQATDRVEGLIISVSRRSAIAETERGLRKVKLMGRPAVVGDSVTLAILSDEEAMVVEVAPRRTKLSRPDVDDADREQVIVANIDIVVIVVSVGTPPLHPRLIDRYLVAIQQGEAEPLIYVNKIDLLKAESELDVLNPYRNLGIPVITGSAKAPGVDVELLDALKGKMCAFVGHSGVGKSSIVNKLKPDAGLETGSVSEGYGRGTHTTTASSLHRLDDGTTLIDTPGIRSFGLRALEGAQITSYFPEFEQFDCKFNDCTHTHEPKCGVVAALESGDLEKVRYEAYCRLREELE